MRYIFLALALLSVYSFYRINVLNEKVRDLQNELQRDSTIIECYKNLYPRWNNFQKPR